MFGPTGHHFCLLEWLKEYLFGVNCPKFYRYNNVDLSKRNGRDKTLMPF